MSDLNTERQIEFDLDRKDLGFIKNPEAYHGLDREAPWFREHDTYEEDYWKTAHIECVDSVFATNSILHGSFCNEKVGHTEETIRLDIDGFGHSGADLHDVGDNIQVSMWIPKPLAKSLYKQLKNIFENSK